MTTEQVNTHNPGGLKWLLKNSFSRWFSVLRHFSRRKPVWAFLIALALLCSLVVLRGSLQPAFLALRKYYLIVLLFFLLLYVFVRLWRGRRWRQRVLLVVATGVLLWLAFLTGRDVFRYFALYRHYFLTEKVELSQLPLTGHERIQPFNSVGTLINQEALSETEDATSVRFVRHPEGIYTYTSCLGPSKGYKLQQFMKNMYQVLEVPASAPSPGFSARYRHKVDFPTGELLLFGKDVHTATRKRFGLYKYFNYEPAEVVFLRNGQGEWIQVVSLIRWRGVFFPRPVFGGVMIHRQSGNRNGFLNRLFAGHGTFIAPGDMANHEHLIGQYLIPDYVARFTAESFRFRNGFFAPMPYYHEGDIRIPELPDDQSPQPFVIYAALPEGSAGAIYAYFGLEPYQREKKGLSLSLFIPGDGTDKVFFMDHDKREDALIGSSAIPAKIRESRKQYDWSENYPAESRPFVRDVDGRRKLLWLSTVVTRAGDQDRQVIGGSIPEITLTDAGYGRVVWIDPDSITHQVHWYNAIRRELAPIWEQLHE